MSADVRRHVVIAIYGVGNPAPGAVQRSLDATLRVVADGMPVEVHEFDWNEFAVHAFRTTDRLWRYPDLFSGSFAAAAWVRSSSPTRLERARTGVDAAVHGLWAVTQAMFAQSVILGVALYLVGAASDFLSGYINSMASIGFLPGVMGRRASMLGPDVLAFAVREIQYGSAATAALLTVSASMAMLEAVMLRSTRPLAVTARRHVFVMLLVPCVLLSLVLFRREAREDPESPFAMAHTPEYWLLMGVGVAAMAVTSIFFGGIGMAFAFSLVGPAILATVVVCSFLARFFGEIVGPVWFPGAKVLLDIGLYVGTPSYRDRIQDQLTRVVASIPDRSTAAIWIVAHSLGSVIALDSLTTSAVWKKSTESVRLVTLGSPIRRFFIRFFPGVYFEPQIDAAARTVAGRVREFTWLNAFRRFDYIGTALGFRQSGRDLPTRQVWPAHSNYWGDERVARTVIAEWPQARPVEPPDARHATEMAPPVLRGVPTSLTTYSAAFGAAYGAALGVATAVVAWWLMFPGLREFVARPAVHMQAPAKATARVRHDRGFPTNFHEFRFEFHDETGREHRVTTSVIGALGVWNDRRFDYRALVRFIRADCEAERPARFYEFGWSVPCSKGGLPIVYDRADPSRFTVIGLEEAPGYLIRACRAAWKALIVALSIGIGLGVPFVVALLWVYLLGLFVGDQEMSDMLDPAADADSAETSVQ